MVKEEAIASAIVAMKKGLSMNTAAKSFGVPRTTLQYRLKQPDPLKVTRGPAPIIGEHETVLTEWIYECARAGFPRRKHDVLDSVKEIVEQLNIPNPFHNNHPGEGWYSAFLKRHPDLTTRTVEAVSRASACVAEDDLRGWFRNVEEYLRADGHLEVLQDPRRCFNGDETNFQLCPNGKTVLAPRGMRNVYEVEPGTAKEALTCMFSFNAAGEMVPPMLVYPYKRIPREIVERVPKNWTVGRSESGWMTSEVFYEYIGNGFNSFLTSNEIPTPVILFVDGHKTHLTIHTSRLCKELGIILVALYPNATRILQPADVAAFRPLKMGWTNAVREWRREHVHCQLTKEYVAPILSSILSSKSMKTTLEHGFRATGLFPWNPDAIDYTKCLGGSSKKDTEPQEAQDNLPNKNVLTADQFLQIIGEEKLKILMVMGDVQPGEEDVSATRALWTIWRDLGSPNLGENVAENVAEDPLPVSAPPPQPAPPQAGSSGVRATRATTAGQILQWPESPKRKGKRQTERMPYVLTSKSWQDLADEKQRKRKADEDAREERKKQREEKKKQREREEEEKKRKREEAAAQRVASAPRPRSRRRK